METNERQEISRDSSIVMVTYVDAWAFQPDSNNGEKKAGPLARVDESTSHLRKVLRTLRKVYYYR